eukprot:864230-Amorphochlora_amoeboformis.AAC.2
MKELSIAGSKIEEVHKADKVQFGGFRLVRIGQDWSDEAFRNVMNESTLNLRGKGVFSAEFKSSGRIDVANFWRACSLIATEELFSRNHRDDSLICLNMSSAATLVILRVFGI